MGYPPGFSIPRLGQTGKPVVINGPFDGNSTNTQPFVTFPPIPPPSPNAPPSTPGTTCPVIAESPRKAVIMVPPNIVGPAQITVSDAGHTTTGAFRNLTVDLTAPKTSLLKGERTTLTVSISGLQNLTQPVPLTLTCNGVITMQGGVYQPMMIQPSQVGSGGIYTTTRDITGVQAGGWGATATVVTRPFNVSLQDDSRPATVILWNTVSGDYSFNNLGGQPKPPVQPPIYVHGGGTGRTVIKGCILTLTHNAPDGRVFAQLDACANSGEATIETGKPKVKLTITDRNTADNSVFVP